MKHIILCFVLFVLVAQVAHAQEKKPAELVVSAAETASDLLLGEYSGVRVSAVDNNTNGYKNIHIRGLNSLRTDNQPVWIVDGVIISTHLNQNLDAFWQFEEQSYTSAVDPLQFLSPENIESIEVIKDVSALAIYGAIGANGVIVVKTKSGQAGKGFNWHSNFRINTDASANLGSVFAQTHHFDVLGGDNLKEFRVSADFRNNTSVAPRNKSYYGILNARFSSRANKVIWFGINANLSIGAMSNVTGTSYLGLSSYTLALRDPALSPGTTAEQWLQDYDDDSMDYRGQLSGWIKFNILPGFTFDIDGGTDIQANDRTIWYGPSTALGAVSAENPGGGAASNLSASIFNYNVKGVFQYQRYFNKSHLLRVKAGADFMGFQDRFNTMNGRDFVSHQLRGKSLNLMGSLPLNHVIRSEYYKVGAFVSLDYSWESKLGVSGTFRYDNALKYKQYGDHYYPAGDAFIDIAKLAFPQSKAVTQLKVSGGYGVSGRDQFVAMENIDLYISGDYPMPEDGMQPFCHNLVNITTSEWHVSLNTAFLSDRLSLGLTYYDRKTTDVFGMYSFASAPIVTKSGTYYKWTDNPTQLFSRQSKIANKGVELDFEAVPIQNKDWKWEIILNGAYNFNEVVSANPEDFHGRAVGQDIYCSCNVIGSPVSSLYGYLADADGKYIDTTGEGQITAADKVLLGNSIPRYTGAFKTFLTWKDLRIDLAFDGAADYQVANINSLVKDGVRDSSGQIALSSKYVENASFLRLSYIGASYSVPLKVKWLKQLQVSFVAKNPLVFTSYSGWNPDVNSYGINSLSNGFDYGSYPMTRSFIFGLGLKF